MKKMFVVLITAVIAVMLMLSGCAPQDAKGPQSWWEGTLAAGKDKSIAVQVVGANGSLGKSQQLPDGAKIRAILDADLKAGSAVQLCRGTRLFAELNGVWTEVNPLQSVKMMSTMIINDFGGPVPSCPCYLVNATTDVPMSLTVFDLATNSPTSSKLAIAPGTNVVFCSCVEGGPVTLTPGTVIFVRSDGGDGSTPPTPCVVEAPMNVTVTGRVGMTIGAAPAPTE